MFKSWFTLGLGIATGIGVVVLACGFIAFTAYAFYYHAEMARQEAHDDARAGAAEEKASAADEAEFARIETRVFGVEEAAVMHASTQYLKKIFSGDGYFDICNALLQGGRQFRKDGFEADTAAAANLLCQRVDKEGRNGLSFLQYLAANMDVYELSARTVDLASRTTHEAINVDLLKKAMRTTIQQELRHPERAVFGPFNVEKLDEPKNYRISVAVDTEGTGYFGIGYYAEVTLTSGDPIIHYLSKGDPPAPPTQQAASYEGESNQAISPKILIHQRVDPETGQPIDTRKSKTPGFGYAPIVPGQDAGHATEKGTPYSPLP